MNKILFWLLPVFILTGCSDDDSPRDDQKQSIQLTNEQKTVVDGYVDFSYKLFNSVSATVSPDDNMIVAPWGAVNILSMFSNAGNEQVRNSISRVLCQTDAADLNSINKYLYGQLTHLTGKVRLNVYRSFWYKIGFNVSSDFLKVISDDYYAHISQFQSAGLLINDFNQWVKKTSEGVLDGSGVPIDDTTTFLLADMMYFNGKWSNRFDTKDSHPGVFHNADGTDADVTMMEVKKPFMWYSSVVFDALWMDFSNGEFSMAIMLPRDGYNVDYLTRNISKQWFENFYTAENIKNKKCGISLVPVTMPKFDISVNTNLGEVFEQIGVNGHLDDLNMDIDDVNFVQKSRITVDENGAVVSSVTTGNEFTDIDFADGEPFVVDRPFVYVVSETSTGVILQIGKIARL